MLNKTLDKQLTRSIPQLQQAEEWRNQTYEDTPARVEAVFRVRMWQDALLLQLAVRLR